MGIAPLVVSLMVCVSARLNDWNLRQQRTPWRFFALTTVASVILSFLGAKMARHVNHAIAPASCNWLGSIVLVALGLWTLSQVRFRRTEHENFTPGFHEFMLMGLTQVLGDLVIGFGTGFEQVSPKYLLLSMAAASVAMYSPFSTLAGRLGRFAPALSGCLLILAGLL